MGLTNCNTQIWLSLTSGAWKSYNLYINTLIILRLVQGVYNHSRGCNKVENLQIHGIFILVATLYETRLLQPEISIWVMNALPNKPSDKVFPCVYFAAYGYLPGFRPCNSITPGIPVSSLRLVRYCLSRHVNCVTQLLKLQAEWQIPWISCRIFPWFTYAFLSSSNNNYHQCTYQPCRKLLRNYLFLPYLG